MLIGQEDTPYTLPFTIDILHFNFVCILCISVLPEESCKKQLKHAGVVSYTRVSKRNLVRTLLVMKLIYVYLFHGRCIISRLY